MEPNQDMQATQQTSNKSFFRHVGEFFTKSFNMSGYIFNKKSIMPYWKLVPLSFILLSLPFTIYYLITVARHLSKATASQPQPATVFISSELNILPPDQLLHVNIDAQNNTLAFVKVVLTFDPAKVLLASNPVVSPVFGTIVQLSTMEEANSTGRVVAIAAVAQGTEAPTSVINDFITFTLSAVSAEPNDTASLSFITNEMQLVDTGSSTAVVIVADPVTYTLNPVATPTPSPSPEPTESPIPSPSPSPTAPPTPSPSPTPAPTGDNQAPSVTMTNPTNGAVVITNSTVNFQATASDNVGVTKVEFWVAGKRKCIDSLAPYTCAWVVPSSPNTYSAYAKAFDASNNTSIDTISITSSN